MKFVRIWADEQGSAHHESMQLEWHEVLNYAQNLPPIESTEPVPAGVVHFVRVLKATWGDVSSGLHPAPRRQMIIVLQGEIELTTADGPFIVGPGDVYLLEDTAG